jgi:hypothetical protein
MDQYRAASTGVDPKVRVCWDGRQINKVVIPWPCRYEDFPAILRQISPDDWCACIDLRSFYLQLPVHDAIQPYLSFKDPLSGEIRKYLKVPFGLTTAPTYASGVSAEASLIVGSHTSCAQHVYLDDTLQRTPGAAGSSRVGLDQAESDLDISIAVLADLGLPVSTEKTVRPSKRVKSLGYMLDTQKRTVGVSEDHRAFTAAYIDGMLSGERYPWRREFHSLCGLMSFLTPAVRGSRSYLRPFWDHLKRLKSWRGGATALPAELLSDLAWWKERLTPARFKKEAKWCNPATVDIEYMWSDASGTLGAGAWFRRDRYFHRWTEAELLHGVPYKELWPIVRILETRGSELRGKILVCCTDSVTNVYAFAAGSSGSPASLGLLRRAAALQEEHDCEVLLLWTPREFNVVTDMISKGTLGGMSF